MIRAGLVLTLVAVGLAVTASSAVAQSAPALAQDGHSLAGEPASVRELFTSVWGDRAAEQWIREHDASLSGGAGPQGPRIGLLYGGTATQNPAFTEGLASGLAAAGYAPGRDVQIIWRFADGNTDALPGLAADLVQQRPDVIVAPVVAEATAVKQASSTIPIVTMTVADPVAAGLAASLEHPGGNVTGVIQQPLDFNDERLAFLHDAVPNGSKVGLLVTAPLNPQTLAGLRAAGARLGLEVVPMEVRTADDLDGIFDSASEQGVDAIMVFGGTLFTANRARIVRLAEEHRLPALYPSRLFVDSGGLMDYAYVEAARGRRAADYVKDILNGANPADLPMEPPPQTEVVLNHDAADAIGYSFPDAVVARATDTVP